MSGDTDKTHNEVGKSNNVLYPSRKRDTVVDVKSDYPGIILIIHGVNDVGVSYGAQEKGLCEGLNERLNRLDLCPAEYRMAQPTDSTKTIKDPDAVLYRRKIDPEKTRSPAIPFYWGVRATKDELEPAKGETKDIRKSYKPDDSNHSSADPNAKYRYHGQYVDKYGNRLDSHFAKEGGMFGNATSELPSMFGGHFSEMAAISDPNITHPLRTALDRRYMVLAAKRLAMMISEIHRNFPNDTVTLLGHSQGCLLSLLAQCFLESEGSRPADCLILQHPPYSLEEPVAEAVAVGTSQQTVAAKLKTLINIVDFVTKSPHTAPPLSDLCDPKLGKGRAGTLWSPKEGQRTNPENSSGTTLKFAERDNRGKVYLYFCPDDMTVRLRNVEGIGALGVHATAHDQASGKMEAFSALSSKRFFQRIWTKQLNDDKKPVLVGLPPYSYKLSGMFSGWGLSRVSLPSVNVSINGEELNPRCIPTLTLGETGHPGKLNNDMVDASVGVTNEEDSSLWQTYNVSDFPPLASYGTPRQTDKTVVNGPTGTDIIETQLNQGKTDPNDQTKVYIAKINNDGKLNVLRKKTNNEALDELAKDTDDNSYHSSIPSNPQHARYVTSMDAAIGQARSLDDPDWFKFLNIIADWRNDIDKTVLISANLKKCFDKLSESSQSLVRATSIYYQKGLFPGDSDNPIKTTIPKNTNGLKLIVNYTTGQRTVDQAVSDAAANQRAAEFGGD